MKGGLHHKDGFVESDYDHGVWYWNFYKKGDWDPKKEEPKSGTKPVIQFEIEEILEDMERDGNSVTFSVVERKPKSKTDESEADVSEIEVSYTLIFPEEDDAEDFTGEEYEQF